MFSVFVIFRNKFFPTVNCAEDFLSTTVLFNAMAGPLEENYAKPLYADGKYDNPFPTWKQPRAFDLCKYFFCDADNSNIPNQKELDVTLPLHHPDFKEFQSPPVNGTRVVWLGHATMLVQFDGVTILTDPIFKGNKQWMEDTGCSNVKEMTWWQEETVPNHPDIRVACTPCQHWSSRTGILDVNQSLWSSWCVIGPTQRFYFAGDTGYCEAFKQIGHRYGPFSLAGIPIGAYQPRWFMRPQHVEPEESVQIHLDVRSEKSIGIHWGTFKLTHEHYLEPKEKLREEVEKQNLSPQDFITLNHGEIRLICNKKLKELFSENC
ncbi:NAPEPLD [Acanthosepion pharaonis]|uniref:N-acetylphosphatidylethanolamine-hydrolyzing phospholipase D n=1 Tax=Acanthosepion pharaonis TaxID=158019 RepID=A0A812DSG8_ACAPH|nr:NAPEPLD [Sepia pharaonis]